MNVTINNFKQGLVPRRSELFSLLSFPLMTLILCITLVITNSIRFPVLAKGRGTVTRSESYPAGYSVTASFTSEDARQIRLGQPVRLLLKKYPADKYGRINGWVQRILPAGSDQWEVIVRLPNGLVTDKNATIPFDPELIGDILVVVKDISLLQRIL